MIKPDADLYISVDIESDGPIPGPYSMLSLGLALAGRFDGDTFEPLEPQARTFYRELQPISDQFLPEAVAVTGLDRGALERNGERPEDALIAAKRWVEAEAGANRPVLVGYPLVFDWMFVSWYFERFAGGSPFGYSSGLDMKSLYAAKARVPISAAGKDDLPSSLRAADAHTHHALDDAVEQAQIFAKLFAWEPDH
jgi:hypothetical protein